MPRTPSVSLLMYVGCLLVSIFLYFILLHFILLVSYFSGCWTTGLWGLGTKKAKCCHFPYILRIDSQELWCAVSSMETDLYQCKVVMTKIKFGRLRFIGNTGFRLWLLSISSFLSGIGKFETFFLFIVYAKCI